MNKKLLLSIAFIAVFGVYAVYEKGNNANPILSKQQSATQNPIAEQTVPVKNVTPPPVQKQNPPVQAGAFKNGKYTGQSVNVFYGNVQVEAVISGGKLTDINFLDYPQDNRSSLQRSNYALPQLKSEAISAQSANVDAVSGASETSSGFIQSLSSALSQAS